MFYIICCCSGVITNPPVRLWCCCHGDASQHVDGINKRNSDWNLDKDPKISAGTHLGRASTAHEGCGHDKGRKNTGRVKTDVQVADEGCELLAGDGTFQDVAFTLTVHVLTNRKQHASSHCSRSTSVFNLLRVHSSPK